MPNKDAMIAASLQTMAAEIDNAFEAALGSRVHFSLLVWAEEGATERFQYVANVPRNDVLRCMREAIKRWEAGEQHVPASQRN